MSPLARRALGARTSHSPAHRGPRQRPWTGLRLRLWRRRRLQPLAAHERADDGDLHHRLV